MPGDERPCNRCVKRGLQDSCQDGVRKKAKYLNDVQPEALMPGVGGHYPHANGGAFNSNPTSVSVPASADYYTPAQSNYNVYGNQGQGNMPPPPLSSNGSFTNQQSPTSPSFQSMTSQQSPPLQTMAASLPSSAQNGGVSFQQSYAFDTTDPALFNFDISGLNFGNQYGAMEFGMLGQMAGGAADSPSNENSMLGSIQMPNYHGSISGASGFNDGGNQNLMFNQDPVLGSDWHANHPRHSSTGSFAMTPLEHTGRSESSIGHHAYAIGAGPGSLASASPASTNPEYASSFDNAPSSPAGYANDSQRGFYGKRGRDQKQAHYPVNQPQPAGHDRKPPNIPLAAFQSHTGSNRKRPRDHGAVYSSVKAPYSYTEGFHSLLAFLDKRYSTDKRVRIAKAISSFRPTLINTYGQLSQDDLIHSEKGFQRLLFEYEDNFIQAYGIPAVILRRTGEVALINKEFSILTGWNKDVLLGKAPNLNANFGGTANNTGSNSRGALNTPKMSTLEAENGKTSKPRPVLIAELMDHDSTVQFWEDCARLAYIDPSGECTRPCHLIKYRPKEEPSDEGGDQGQGNVGDGAEDSSREKTDKREQRQDRLIKPEAEIHRLGMHEGTVNCMYTWNIKRDIFDAPMMFILTVSGPVLYDVEDFELTLLAVHAGILMTPVRPLI